MAKRLFISILFITTIALAACDVGPTQPEPTPLPIEDVYATAWAEIGRLEATLTALPTR